MNANLYRHVYSKRVGCLVAVSDISRSEGGDGVSCGAATTPLSLRQLSVALALIIGSAAAHAQAQPTLPTGGVVVGGMGKVSTVGNTLTVQQKSANLAVNWDTFNIGKGATVEFKQPSKSSVALNSVLGNSASAIYGSLISNGQVFLINPNGVLFGKSAQVSVGSLFASTLPINTTAFMAGTYAFGSGTDASGSVVNQGNLVAKGGGFVVLAGNHVINTGTISATSGTVALAAGNSVTLALDNANHATVNVTSATLSALIQNHGLIEADGGQVLLTARGRNMLQSSVMNLAGVIQANTVGTQGGQIVINGGDTANGDSGTVSLSHLTASALGSRRGTRGGSVTVTGPSVNLAGSTINASGNAGGGSVLVGGGAHGSGALAHAQAVTMDSGSTIDASAVRSGNGGTVVLWSDASTAMNGTILARGGSRSGDGGFIETSSKGLLGGQGIGLANAPHGKAGSWLLDPTDITVSTGGNATGTGTWTVNNVSLSNSLQSGTNVVLAASNGTGSSGFINVTADVTSSGSGNLSLLAANGQNVTLGANISLGNGSLTATGGNGNMVAATLYNDVPGVGGGSVVLNAGNTLSAANVVLTGGAGAAGANGPTNDSLDFAGVDGQAGGSGGSVVLNGSVRASGTATFLGGLGGAGGGGGGGGGQNGYGGYGGAGGAGGSIQVNANVSAATVNFMMGAGGSSGGGGGAGSTISGAQVTGLGGNVRNAGAAGALTLGNATVDATNLVNVVGASGGGGGGGGTGTNSAAGTPGGQGAAGTASGGGHGGIGSLGAGGVGGAAGTNGGAGADGVGGGYFGGGGGVGGAGSSVYVNGNATLSGANVSFTALTPIVINKSLTLNVSGSPLIANNISGSGKLTQAGSGTTTLTGTNSYSGTTVISGGTLAVGNGGTTGTLGSGAVLDDANLAFNFSGGPVSYGGLSWNVIDNPIGGTGNILVAGSNALSLTVVNAYSGTISSAGKAPIYGVRRLAPIPVSVPSSY